MTWREKTSRLYQKIDEKCLHQFGFRMKEATFTKIENYLHEPKDASSLAVTRILFGVCMLLDIPDERGGATMDSRWGRPHVCHFPLFPFLTALPMPYMAVIYAILWVGALGITLGYKYRTSCVLFTTCYWYVLLIDKSFWNNHSYLFGLVGLLMTFTQAHCYWSIDAHQNPSKHSTTVPYWNYFILKYQFFILYFMAGLKKGTAEWLTGYSVQKLAEHWVFDPFKWFLTVQQIDYLIVHWFIFAFDLTVAFWMMWAPTRLVAMIFCAMFHLMNSRLFAIGMFPWVCLATLPLFYPFDWPKRVLQFFTYKNIPCKCNAVKLNPDLIDDDDFKDGITALIENQENCDELLPLIENQESCDEMQPLIENQENCDEMLPLIENQENCDETLRMIENQENCDEMLPLIENQENCDEMLPLIENEENCNEIPFSTENDPVNILQSMDNQNNQAQTLYTQTESQNDADIKATKEIIKSINNYMNTIFDKNKHQTNLRKKLTTVMIFVFMIVQAFLPYSHFITKGYNNWTNGLYGYSWDMMVHSWESIPPVVKVVDNELNKELFIDPLYYTANDRWTRHGDMVYQYARCLERVLMKYRNYQKDDPAPSLSQNISIYIDIWYSLNGRFAQRMFDPKTDILSVKWTPFEPIPFLMPLLDEGLSWRSTMDEIKTQTEIWNNRTSVVFYADFPGYDQEKYISEELKNVTLTILEGKVGFQTETGHSYAIFSGNRIEIPSGTFHTVKNIGTQPIYYMYTFTNTTDMYMDSVAKPKLPIAKELYVRFEKMCNFANLVISNVFYCALMARCI